MLQKGSESDDSNSQNAFSAIWQLLAPALTAILPILLRLAFARIGNKTQARAESADDTERKDESMDEFPKNGDHLSPQNPREPMNV